mmetsp:Transcript_3066/g.4715  ORF Transcript_3066/g.4715 Transcript_3066/m.4715 type:complete len:158 (-) Transcript_3066:259-732(-)
MIAIWAAYTRNVLNHSTANLATITVCLFVDLASSLFSISFTTGRGAICCDYTAPYYQSHLSSGSASHQTVIELPFPPRGRAPELILTSRIVSNMHNSEAITVRDHGVRLEDRHVFGGFPRGMERNEVGAAVAASPARRSSAIASKRQHQTPFGRIIA